MCDTMVKMSQDGSIFAKNSDRDPGEPQLISYCTGLEGISNSSHPEHRNYYDSKQYLTLQKAAKGFASPYKALISRPSWMWGAEMGVNELGVAIGNEAVFSTSPVDKNGLLGMDILRLALHNSASSQEAVSIIKQLIAEYGQGGNGSYSSHLNYHNSFLIHDGNKAFILETANKRWVIKEVDSFASISNAYTIKKDYQDGDARTLKQHYNFTRRHASIIHLLFTKANQRQRFSSSHLLNSDSSWTSARNILISNKGTVENPDHSMGSICLNAKHLVKSQTTASMIVEYNKDTSSNLVWLTGSPLPTYSPYIPFTLSTSAFATNPFSDLGYCYDFAKERVDLTKKIEKASPQTLKQLSFLSREFENKAESLVRSPFVNANSKLLDEACLKCQGMIPSHMVKVYDLLSSV